MRDYKVHCLVVPFPAQGHINPMLQFSKRLQHKGGIKVTLALTHFMFKMMKCVPSGPIAIDTISDGKEEGDDQLGIETYSARFQQVGSKTLADLLEKFRRLDCPVDCIVYDAFMPWVLDVARQFGSVGAVFFTQSCAVNNIYHHVHEGLLKLPLTTGSKVVVPGLPLLEPSDMPSFISHLGSYPGTLEMFANQFSNVGKADWILVNTFYRLEDEVIDWMAKLWPLKTIGPTIPSMFLDKRLQDDREYGLNMYNPKAGACIEWLNERPEASVAYVAFGSMAQLGIEQIEELAWGLRKSNKYYLWVVRGSEQAKLPRKFLEEKSEKGLMVSWSPQLEVLAHKALGCFVTHCGWNSTLEALSVGVPLIAMPQWTDQSTNAKYVMDVWENGLSARADADGIVRRDEVENCIREVMEGERGKNIRKNATKWKELAKAAVDEGGTSDRNIDDFVAKVLHT